MTRVGYIGTVVLLLGLVVIHALCRDPTFVEDLGAISLATGYRRHVVRTDRVRRQIAIEASRLADRLDAASRRAL